MEAVPRLPMLWFALKSSPEGTSFLNLKKYIAECYQEDPELYSKEVYALETLRNKAMRPEKDVEGCSTLKKYYCQLHSLVYRFPTLKDSHLFTFTWKDLYVNNVNEVTDIRYEMAAVLFNIAALHTQAGASVSRVDANGMKSACTHYQCSAWAFGELKEKYNNINSGDFMTPELLLFMQQVSFAQAQECILEKSLLDNRKPGINAKVTAQIINYYSNALVALLTGGEDGSIAQVIDSSVHKTWKKYVRFKISYLNCILLLSQGQQAEEQQKMGERVALFQAAWDKLEEAKKESKGLQEQKEIIESLTFTADVVEGKRRNATNENEFIYHEPVPELTDIAAVQGANLVNGISFSVTDPEVMGEDIFARLVPMKAHEASSLYSEEKAKLLREIGVKIDEKDTELMTFLSSLNLDQLNISEERSNKIPQGIVDRCASLNAKTNAIPDLIASMSNLAEICTDVEMNLKEIKSLLSEENENEKQYQQRSGIHRPNTHIAELTREFQKYSEAHNKAGESNETLRRAMDLHVKNLRILSRPLQDIQSSVPKLSSEVNENVFKDLKLVLNKVNEMKAQRAEFHAELRIAINNDDITSKVIACESDKDLKDLFKEELAKHDKITALIEQNLKAQENILSALTDTYAKTAPILKTMADVKHKKDDFFASLAASYDVYEDLLTKSAKGLEFYKKLQGNVQKLLARVRAARDVQDEERQQRMKLVTGIPSKVVETVYPASNCITISKTSALKLKDYLKSGKTSTTDTTYIPSIRPNPLGSETPSTSACATSMPSFYTSQAQSIPSGTTYTTGAGSLTQNLPQFSDVSGYINPIYQNVSYNDANLPSFSYSAIQYPTHNELNSTFQASQAYQMPSSNNMIPQIINPYAQLSQKSVGNEAYPNVQQQNTTVYPYHQQVEQYSNQNQVYQPVYSQDSNVLMSTAAVNNPATTNVHYSDNRVHSTQESQLPQQQPQLVSNVSTQPNQQHVQQLPSFNSNLSQQMQPQQSVSAGNELNRSLPIQTTHSVDLPAILSHAATNNWNATELANQFENFQLQKNQGGAPQYPTSQFQEMSLTSSALTATPYYQQSYSYATHPGYSFNPQTGEYQYASGYQHQGGLYSQYTNATPTQIGNTMDTASSSYSQPQSTQLTEVKTDATDYYSAPYGYQSAGNSSYSLSTDISIIQSQPSNMINSSASTYMQSNNNSSTETTVSGGYANSIQSNAIQQLDTTQQHQQATEMEPQQTTISQNQPQQTFPEGSLKQQPPIIPQQASQNQQQTPPTPKASSANVKSSTKLHKTSNIDLLSGIDFAESPPSLPLPPLQPVVASTKSTSQIISTERTLQLSAIERNTINKEPETPQSNIRTLDMILPTSSEIGNSDRKLSCDNLSICSDLSSLDQSFDWDSVSIKNEQQSQKVPNETVEKMLKSNTNDHHLDEPTIFKYFHKEVERYEKVIDSLNVKMLNGNTPLLSKWKELQDLLAKDDTKRSTSIGKLFPEKNRSIDCIPYDHARVVLEKSTDDYINAAFVKDLGAGCPMFILAQTPLTNTVNDFWSMVWIQKSRVIACLHTPNEILDPFWPQDPSREMNFDDYSVTLIKKNDLSHCIEFHLKLKMSGAETNLDLCLLQIKTWSKNSPPQILAIAHNILSEYNEKFKESRINFSIVLNCLTGSERSGIIALAICAILGTHHKRPILINVVDVWYRISSQRKNALKDINNLELSMQIVLNNAHDVLNKHGIMTSYQIKVAEKVAIVEKEEIKDPLNDLDPLWKLK